jgi:hypothetical protein
MAIQTAAAAVVPMRMPCLVRVRMAALVAVSTTMQW